jgi:hypothetical protein
MGGVGPFGGKVLVRAWREGETAVPRSWLVTWWIAAVIILLT